ncbi:substrate-binding domain-containing protein [Desulfosarcina ovata]|uniref:Tungsten ABC transporter substrate-binding protein n=2 Tax=Desulfosarcina ovata TaxID=83564 RepID=A0A5K8AEI9_9BACT|nr:substrate-binding domain-containing protein [Desulfosarcina ovata]BBO84563.1 tungsten ABC transporter substrate-binding protein [Desulfosarcina ovata subsp. sediminis]BBO91042.1 tungsten ABC transporter substrate-binding protein [Desulfosarcina ovata subsp. ovata]
MKKLTTVCIILALSLMVALPVMAADKVLMMATTTSTDNTGLLDYLRPHFTKATGIEWKWTAVGTGKALKHGENCDVDVLMVHAPAAEKEYVDKGALIDRREIMYNDFVIIGPASDPAGIRGKSVVDALASVRAKGAVFASRGDNSGTNKKEISLWKSAGGDLPEKESWYVQTGQGMLATINIANERNGYTMTDRGTYIKYADTMKGNPPLKVLVEGDAILLNQYSVLAVNPAHCQNAKYDLATAFSDWIAGAQGQKLIRDFKLLGKPLFVPNAK